MTGLTHYSLSSNLYKSKIFTGFSQLLKHEEFVDLTLAADGYMVKVHKSVIALASPYLREVLKSMPNNSPAIFLNNVSHEILTYLLEYIYQGEVKIPADSIDAFIEVSKSLYIAGIEDLKPPKGIQPSNKKPPEKRNHSNTLNIMKNNDNLMEVQEYPISNILKDAHYETDNSVENQYQPEDIINIAKFIILQNENSDNIEQQNKTSNDPHLLANVPKIDISDYRQAKIQTQLNRNIQNNKNLLQSQEIPDQLAQANQNNPTIEINGENITTGQQNQEANPKHCSDYKIIVKRQIDAEQDSDNIEPLQNIPVIEIQHFGLPDQQEQEMTAQNYILPHTDISHAFQENPTLPTQTCLSQNQNDKTNIPVIKILDDQVIKTTINIPFDCKMNALKNMSQFSITERGQIHLILNRYMYYCHHMTHVKRRWRCINYRRERCPAFVDTMRGVIVARKGVHSHSFHDNKIYKKHKKGLIYQTMELALAAREKVKNQYLTTVSINTTDDEA